MNDVQNQDRGDVRVQPSAAPTLVPTTTVNMSATTRRIYPFGRSNRQNLRPRRSPGFILFQRQRQKFITRVYLLATVFEVLTVLQWVSIVSNPILVDFLKDRYYILLMAGLTALLFVTFFGLFFEIRYIEPYNWIFAYSIVELETLGLLRAPLDSDLSQLGICLIATIGINATFTFIGIKVSRDLTRDILVVIVISLIFYLAASVILIILIATEIYHLKMFLIIGTILLLLVYIMYVSQLISGDRSGSVRWNDFILAALMVYFNFMLTFSSILHLSNEFVYDVSF